MTTTAETNPWRDCPQCGADGTFSTFVGHLCTKCHYRNTKKRRKVCLILAVSSMLILCTEKCRAGVVTESFIQRVAMRESGNNPRARGKAGERSAYQLKRVAVQHVNQHFGWSHSFEVATTRYARQYAEAYLIMMEANLRSHYRRQPTEVEVYRAYNRGFAGSLKGDR